MTSFSAPSLSSSWRRYPLSHLLTLVIILLSLLPIGPVEIAQNVPFADKWTHMVMYGTFTFVIWMEYLRCHQRLSAQRLFRYAFLAPIAMSGLLELLQAYATTYRSGEWLDLAANTVGVCIGTLLGLSLHALIRARRR